MSGYIAVVDYHKGNLLSVERGLAAAGAQVLVTDDPGLIAGAQGAVVPGVGAFDDAMTFMRSSGQADAVSDLIRAERPVLGICLGMQLFFDRGNEHAVPPAPGEVPAWLAGMGVMPGDVDRLKATGVKVPHMGWNAVDLTGEGRRCPLFEGVGDGTYFYFTHSYACAPKDPRNVAATTEHGVRFASAVWDGGRVFGTQFHPEKSSGAGRLVMDNFVSIVQGRFS